jgi:hypothetical protein
MTAKIALDTDGNDESGLKSTVIRPARGAPFCWGRNVDRGRQAVRRLQQANL